MFRAGGWREGTDSMTLIIIVREFTAIGLAEAKGLLNRVRSGEVVDLHPYQPGRSGASTEKLRRYLAGEIVT